MIKRNLHNISLIALFFIPTLLFPQAWVARYNGPANLDDEAHGLAVDNSGNVYVTGYANGYGEVLDYGTVKYNANGTQLWSAIYDGGITDIAWAIAVDNSGNVYVTGESDGDILTIKYSTNGTQLWTARYDYGSADLGRAIAVDNSGNVYVTGSSIGSGTNFDFVTIKYNTNGSQLWVARYNGPANGRDYVEAIAVDNSGNVYVTGSSEGSGSNYDYATIKYNTNGSQLWVARYNGPANNEDRPFGTRCIAVDNSGNVYVTGSSYGSAANPDYATIKYNTNGSQLWVARYNGPGNAEDWARAVAVDNSGNVYVTGSSAGSGTSWDYATIKYDANGNQLWVARYNGPGNYYDNAFDLAVDGSGNVYVTGGSYASGTLDDYTTVKYSASGSQLWVARYNGPVNGGDRAYRIAVDNSGNVYVTGGSQGSNYFLDFVTIKYQDIDVGCTRIVAPTGTVNQGTTVTPACSVYNYGSIAVSYTVRMKIGTLYNQTATVTNHLPGTRLYITFPNWTASELGNLAVSCSTGLNGDMNTGNDRATGSVFVQYLDAQCVSVDAPTGTVNRGAVIQPKATIKNNGNTTQSITARLTINDGSGYNYTVTQSLSPGQQLQYTFPNWTANNPGSWTVKCTTELSGDMNTGNDRATGSVFVQYLDAQCVSIVQPTGTVNQGTVIAPKAVIRNNGNTPQSITARFVIQDGSGYNHTVSQTLNPNEELEYTFPDWTANNPGFWTVKCTTELDGDMDNANDKQEEALVVQTGGQPGGWVKLSVEVPMTFPSRMRRIKSGGLIVYGGDKIYIVKGNNTKDFYSFVPETVPVWIDSVPIVGKRGVKRGTGMVYDGRRYLYFASGTNTFQFWRYDTENNSWESLPSIPFGGGRALTGGTGMAYANGKVYLLKGSKTNEFYAFDCASNTWESLPAALEGSYPGKGYRVGSCLVAYDENTLYALRGKYNEFYKYDISARTWTKDSTMPFYHPMWNRRKKVGEGAAMVVKEGKIYAFKGGNTKEFWGLTPPGGWVALETIPKIPDMRYVKGGGGLCVWNDGTIYALKGNNTVSIWKYTGSVTTFFNLPNIAPMAERTGKKFDKVGLRIVPNPIRDLTKVYYNLPKGEVAILRIYNTLGNLVYAAKGDKGEFTIKKLPAGIYLLRFESEGYKEERKLIVVK
ncbi:MAG: SBBP repeat-containing protein [candidate division WOR-3 bacterium]